MSEKPELQIALEEQPEELARIEDSIAHRDERGVPWVRPSRG